MKSWKGLEVAALVVLTMTLISSIGYGSEAAKEYASIKMEAENARKSFREQYLLANSPENRAPIVENSRAYVTRVLTGKIFPSWYGTPWEFNGHTRIPGKGTIACGTFVVYTLQDASFDIPDRMARQPSESIIKNLVTSSTIKRFSNSAPMEKVLEWVRKEGYGIYLVGLDIHVGFIIHGENGITFCHSN